MGPIGDLSKAIGQIPDRRFLSVFLRALLFSALLLIGAVVAIALLIAWAIPPSITLPFIGEITLLDEGLSLASLPVTLFLSSFLMIPVAALFIGLFLDEIADAVEARYYPGLPRPRRTGWIEGLLSGLRFALVFMLVNGVALIFYLIFTPVAPFIFWLVNGYLIGREFFVSAAMRHRNARDTALLRRRFRGQMLVLGALLAIPMTVPLLNLAVPVIGIAAFVHLTQRVSRPSGQTDQTSPR